MKTLFDPSLYQFDQAQPSYWEATAGSSKLKSETLSGTQSCDGPIIHGNGVNSATWSGRELARWLAGENSGDSLMPTHLPAIIRGRPPKFPLAFLRRQYVRAGLSFYSLRDRFNF
jgi:hypothetical protein